MVNCDLNEHCRAQRAIRGIPPTSHLVASHPTILWGNIQSKKCHVQCFDKRKSEHFLPCVCRGIVQVMSCSSVDTIEIIATAGLQVTHRTEENTYFIPK
jgi:hypothetical protein